MKTTQSNLLIPDFELPGWPRIGDKLFQDGINWEQVARLDMGGKEFTSYTSGYNDAANLLAEEFLRDRKGKDVLTFPMVYCYRHFVELRLKEIIVCGQRVLGKPVEQPEGHVLAKLWTQARSIIEEISATGYWPKDFGELSIVSSLIEELNKIDPDGERFRYPVTSIRKGCQVALPNLTHVDVQQLFDVMQRFASFLDGCIDGMFAINVDPFAD